MNSPPSVSHQQRQYTALRSLVPASPAAAGILQSHPPDLLGLNSPFKMAASGTLDAFHLFPRLPSELRLQIWNDAFPRRVVTVHYVHNESGSSLKYFCSPDPLPAVFSACKESRSEALSVYTKAFSSGSAPRYIWVNFTTDTIRINDYSVPEIMIEERQLIRWLVLESTNDEFLSGPFCDALLDLRDLEEWDIQAANEIALWSGIVPVLLKCLTDKFSGLEGWKCPTIRLSEMDTDIKMNYQYHQK
ncbi:hypothetical protein V492_01377 [Pseudogymnoascus sp. VKM F-4246]|nr:hypothetical protein V492_01377 [Pseudogymnoascus sp. VKM F-4246]